MSEREGLLGVEEIQRELVLALRSFYYKIAELWKGEKHMKKVVTCCLIMSIVLGMSFSCVAAEKDAGAAGLLSAILPGTGEWYNSGFTGSYPWAECITGAICPLIQLSSIFDAVAGKTDSSAIRIDFWSAP